MSVKFCSGLDLGQAADFSCLVIIQKEVVNLEPEPQNSVDREAFKMMAAGCMRVPQGMSVIDMCPKPPPKTETRYSLRYLKRWVLGSSYPAIVRHVSEIFSKPPLEGSTLAIDLTGVGRPIFDLFREAKPHCKLMPISITAGQESRPNELGGFNVPKKDLVGALQRLLQTRRLKVAKSLPEAAQLVRELENFRIRITANANEQYEAWRQNIHDDMVLAAAICCWVFERGQKQFWIR